MGKSKVKEGGKTRGKKLVFDFRQEERSINNLFAKTVLEKVKEWTCNDQSQRENFAQQTLLRKKVMKGTTRGQKLV